MRAKSYPLYPYLLLLFFVLTSSTSARTKVTLSPSLSYNLGDTEYILHVKQLQLDSTGLGTVTEVRSRLVFPLDAPLLGATLELIPADELSGWYFNGSIYTNLLNPNTRMTDQDWLGGTGYGPLTSFSYTESDAEMRIVILDLEVARRLYTNGPLSFSLVGGFRHQKISQDIIGYDGWQRPLDTLNRTFLNKIEISSDQLALTYEIVFTQPKFGIRTLIDNGSRLAFDLKTLYAPTFFTDEDDHVLRNKLSTADGDGHCFLASANLRVRLGNGTQADRFIELFSDFTLIDANGTQTQEWYDDEVAAGSSEILVPAGTIIGSLPHEVNSTQFNLGLRFGFVF